MSADNEEHLELALDRQILWRTRGHSWGLRFLFTPSEPNLDGWYSVVKDVFGGQEPRPDHPIFRRGTLTYEEVNEKTSYPFLAAAFTDPELRDEAERPIPHYLICFLEPESSAKFPPTSLPEDWPQQVLKPLRSSFSSPDVFEVPNFEADDLKFRILEGLDSNETKRVQIEPTAETEIDWHAPVEIKKNSQLEPDQQSGRQENSRQLDNQDSVRPDGTSAPSSADSDRQTVQESFERKPRGEARPESNRVFREDMAKAIAEGEIWAIKELGMGDGFRNFLNSDKELLLEKFAKSFLGQSHDNFIETLVDRCDRDRFAESGLRALFENGIRSLEDFEKGAKAIKEAVKQNGRHQELNNLSEINKRKQLIYWLCDGQDELEASPEDHCIDRLLTFIEEPPQ